MTPLARAWRALVLYGLFALLLIAGWHELPEGESILLPWYVIIASAAVPAFIAHFWSD